MIALRLKSMRWLAVVSLLALTPGCWFVSKKDYNKVARRALDCESERQGLQEQNQQLTQANQALRQEKADILSQMQERIETPPAADKELAKLYAQLAALANENVGIEWSPEENVLRMADVLFDFAKADLRDSGRRAITKVAAAIERESPNIIVRIDGHTDNVPVKRAATKKRFGDLWGLAAQRALTVLRALQRQGIAANRLYIRAFAAERPIADNSTAEGRQKNRRVEISFIARSGAISRTAK